MSISESIAKMRAQARLEKSVVKKLAHTKIDSTRLTEAEQEYALAHWDRINRKVRIM